MVRKSLSEQWAEMRGEVQIGRLEDQIESLKAERARLREAFETFINQVHESALEPDKLYIYEGRARAKLKEAGNEHTN